MIPGIFTEVSIGEPVEITKPITKEMIDEVYRLMIPMSGKVRDLKKYFDREHPLSLDNIELFVYTHLR